MTTIVPAEGVILDRILESSDPCRHEGLARQAYRQFEMGPDEDRPGPRGGTSEDTRSSMVTHVLASARQYTLAAVIGRAGRCASAASAPRSPNPTAAVRAMPGTLIEHLLNRAARDGAEMALMFSERRVKRRRAGRLRRGVR